ncbi:hypothetical protein [Flavobacterium sp. 3HN19-14]|uniref:hypothetical protein n=1 Tax=Flavobacterium sp. 3HN19-14 TaxID=3448133 RepID=UPI003EE21C1E
MSQDSKSKNNDQEIDLSAISKGINNSYERFLSWIFGGFLFVIKNIIILILLFIVSAGLGFYLDGGKGIYTHEVIVTPNFGSVEYTYSKIGLIAAKVKERDTVFLKKIGITKPSSFLNIKIEPITDIYGFISSREQNFDLIKLMAEDGQMEKIIEDGTTSRNYAHHKLIITTEGKLDSKVLTEPLLDYLNQSDYFQKVQKSEVESINLKIKTNEETIAQINNLLAGYSAATLSGNAGKSGVFISDNTQLNDVLKTKNDLTQDVANQKIALIGTDKIVKDNSAVLNMKDTKSLNGKLKFILPVLFIGLFIAFKLVFGFYKRQMAKLKQTS